MNLKSVVWIFFLQCAKRLSLWSLSGELCFHSWFSSFRRCWCNDGSFISTTFRWSDVRRVCLLIFSVLSSASATFGRSVKHYSVFMPQSRKRELKRCDKWKIETHDEKVLLILVFCFVQRKVIKYLEKIKIGVVWKKNQSCNNSVGFFVRVFTIKKSFRG